MLELIILFLTTYTPMSKQTFEIKYRYENQQYFERVTYYDVVKIDDRWHQGVTGNGAPVYFKLAACGNGCCFHNNDGPALIYHGKDEILYGFFYLGENIPIEQLTCDAETKCILVLKYGEACKEAGAVWYKD